ncbi:cytochrome c oxidase assembly protein COX16 homolog l(3)neo43 isoform X1 [Oratosquilla oratoria]|uniref:cytochrome c oxidase assembly protein COX16 homolog l(3)neo43 isoform X1 n=1 Tax=Oratosquilla oratoria TaxID=337810 RepID=UPI003F76FA7D
MTSFIPCAGPAHVLYRVSELANVKSLTRWSNTKAKVLGKLSKYSIYSDTAYIESVADPDGTFTIKNCGRKLYARLAVEVVILRYVKNGSLSFILLCFFLQLFENLQSSS